MKKQSDHDLSQSLFTHQGLTWPDLTSQSRISSRINLSRLFVLWINREFTTESLMLHLKELRRAILSTSEPESTGL